MSRTKPRRAYYVKDEALKMLETGRKGAIKVSGGERFSSPEAKAARAVANAIDDLVEALTGDRELFWDKGHGG
ncbi:hypothetical protein [Nitratireductor sp. XY-223]|uniref:hypothetical protein n=1 Tax=Nitratireductor sp. XY-223 TaxID=2561926 RepID=UPI0010A9AC69|nr:hypothetical protein [Nitratireductor sp. XY-223]